MERKETVPSTWLPVLSSFQASPPPSQRGSKLSHLRQTDMRPLQTSYHLRVRNADTEPLEVRCPHQSRQALCWDSEGEPPGCNGGCGHSLAFCGIL